MNFRRWRWNYKQKQLISPLFRDLWIIAVFSQMIFITYCIHYTWILKKWEIQRSRCSEWAALSPASGLPSAAYPGQALLCPLRHPRYYPSRLYGPPTVHRETNPRFWELLRAFKNQTGYGVIVNTSFNVQGEPIVCTPDDAYRCFMRTDMDYLVAENYIFAKGGLWILQNSKASRRHGEIIVWWYQYAWRPLV